MWETEHMFYCNKHDKINISRMWKKAVWLEGNKEEESTVPSTWIVEGSQILYWPSKVNAYKALPVYSREDPDPKSWRKFLLVKVKIVSGKYSRYIRIALTTITVKHW